MKDRYTYLLCYFSSLIIYGGLLFQEDFSRWFTRFLETHDLTTSDGAPIFWAGTAVGLVLNSIIVSIGQRGTSHNIKLDTFLASTTMILLAFISAWILFFMVLASGKIGG